MFMHIEVEEDEVEVQVSGSYDHITKVAELTLAFEDHSVTLSGTESELSGIISEMQSTLKDLVN